VLPPLELGCVRSRSQHKNQYDSPSCSPQRLEPSANYLPCPRYTYGGQNDGVGGGSRGHQRCGREQ
jgi:hypothetical protein